MDISLDGLGPVEPDPGLEWDAERVAATIAQFQELAEVVQAGRAG